MRILHTSDWHLGKNLEGVSRMDEQESFLKDFISIVEREKIDLVIIAGDIYDTSNPPARAENMFYDTLKKLSNKGERMTLIISGNHDNPDRLVAARPLAREHGIVMVATPKSVVEIGSYGENSVVDSGEGFIEVDIKGERAVILTVPYPSEKRLDEVLYDSIDEEDRLENYSARIKLLFSDLSKKYREDTINLAVSHLFVMGGEESSSERAIQLGGSLIVGASCFPEKAQYVALGHLHKPQIVPRTDKRVRYSGSPIHYSKSEVNFQKGCYIIEVKPKEEAKIEEVKFDVYKPIDIWKCNGIEEAIKMCEENKDRDSYVYLEITTDTYISEEYIKKMKKLKGDILEIKPKIIGEKAYEEIENIREKPLGEIFKEFYIKSKGLEPTEELMDLFFKIAGEGECEE